MATAAVLFGIPAMPAAQPTCFPLPHDYRVVLDIREGSVLSLHEVFACLAGVAAVRDRRVQDRAVSLSLSDPVPLEVALVEANRALSREGLAFRRSSRAIRLVRTGRKTRSEPVQARPIRLALRARAARITTEQEAPSRAILEDPDAVRVLGPGHVVVSETVRALAKEDPIAFASEGAAFPNPLPLPEPGFFLTWLRPGGFFERLGLRTGDLIPEINGFRLRSIPDAFRAYEALQDAQFLVVRVRRGVETRIWLVEFADAPNGASAPAPREDETRWK